MDKVTQLTSSANNDIAAGDVYRASGHKIIVLEVSTSGDVIWYDDGEMHIVTPSAKRLEFCQMVGQMEKESRKRFA